jgi:hypothetical protein
MPKRYNSNPFEDQLAFMQAAGQSAGVYNDEQLALYVDLIDEEFTEVVTSESLENFLKELADLRTFAAEKLSFKEDMMPWDVSFFAERLREAEFDFNEVRPLTFLHMSLIRKTTRVLQDAHSGFQW